MRISLVDLLEDLLARRSRCAVIFCFLCVFARPVSLTTPPSQAPVPGFVHYACTLIIHACLCVCASICTCEKV